MNQAMLLHAVGLASTFAAVAFGSYGLLLEVTALGLWPIVAREERSTYREVTFRLGRIAAARGWLRTLSKTAQRELAKRAEQAARAERRKEKKEARRRRRSG